MRGAFFRITKSFVSALLIFSVLLTLGSCSHNVGADELMSEFVKSYGIGKNVFSKNTPEGDAGYAYDGFLETLYGDIGGCVSDFAIVFTSDLKSVGECAVFICYSAYDAMSVTEACFFRIDMIKTMIGSQNTAAADDAFVIRRGKTVIMSVLEDNIAAKRIWEKIL